MGQTDRFGFETFGGDQGGDLSDRGFKFSIRDRQLIDHILSAFEAHSHGGGEALGDPVGAPVITLDQDEDGLLPAGTDLYYRISLIDQFGLETAASDEYTIRTPDALEEPAAPAAMGEAGAGLLSRPGAYQYALTVVNAGDAETLAGDSTTIRLNPSVSGYNTVRLSMPELPVGGVAFNVYRMGPGESEFLLIDQTTAPHEEYLDTGLPGDVTRPLPTENLTGLGNIVHIGIGAADLIPGPGGLGDPEFVLPDGVYGWRIYRAFESGQYDDASLVHEVIERMDEIDPSSPLVITWDDIGEETFDGVPLEISTTLTPSAPVGDDAPTDAIILTHRAAAPAPGANNGALFVTSGVLYFIGGEGTITEIAPA